MKLKKNRVVKHLIYDGVLFYNTFLEAGNKKFIEVPDKIKKDYKSFKTVENTEKYIFMVWLNDTISSLQEKIYQKEDYARYIEVKRGGEKKEAEEKLKEQLVHCKNCGAKIRDKSQEYCEECGKSLIEQIY